ncbi:hypothetical protein HEK616_42700 [Streptomyces nigrescens]|uniref:Uncharacterized protein n=2 Tax=Streptomyces TaxID=1883 RepID=A0ABM7ZX28_STRNI|nr:hypothetical protein [Streptomyces nigrescens]MEE4422188.1 hypothetical protein [Streptomyces sp. DSM 41528]BDM70783.1 hypothetical protein HEK616_42700 [Streptomyces nigrescens]
MISTPRPDADSLPEQPVTVAAKAHDSPQSRTFAAIGTLLVLGIVALAGLLLRMPLDDFRYASGASGTPGTFSATRCHTVPVGRGGSSRACTGTFAAADGGFTDHAAHLTDARIKLGRAIPLQRASDGRYVRPLASAAARDLAGVFAIVWGAGFLLVLVAVGWTGVRLRGGLPLRSSRQPGGKLLPLLGWLYVGSGAAAVLSLVAAVVLALTGR